MTGTNGTSYSLPYNGGTITVAPTSTTTYTATATNSHGSTTAQVTITVTTNTPNPTVTISAQNSSINPGSSDTADSYSDKCDQCSGHGIRRQFLPAVLHRRHGDGDSNHDDDLHGRGKQCCGATASAQTTVTVGSSGGDVSKVQHVIFMMQENRSFDSYFGMLNPYRRSKGWNVGDDGKTYDVDGIDDKLNTISNKDDEGDTYYLYKFRTTCIDDDSSDWLASYGM